MQSRAVAGKPRDVAVNGVYMIVEGSKLLRIECGKLTIKRKIVKYE